MTLVMWFFVLYVGSQPVQEYGPYSTNAECMQHQRELHTDFTQSVGVCFPRHYHMRGR